MSRSIVVIDYGIGNVFSVCNALKKVGADPVLTRDPATILAANRVILPGVGAFGRAINALRGYGLDDTLKRFADTGRPFLGICIGMQLLMDSSLEFGKHTGLGFISGQVDKIPGTSTDGIPLRVPHISWSVVRPADAMSSERWSETPLADDAQDQAFYFVHSFQALPADNAHLLALADYSGIRITAAICRDNIMGVQFHPERSGAAGLRLLKRFAAL